MTPAPPPSNPAQTYYSDSMRAISWQKLDSLPIEIASLNLKPTESLFIRLPSDMPLDAIKSFAVALSEAASKGRKFVVVTEDVGVMIRQDEAGILSMRAGVVAS